VVVVVFVVGRRGRRGMVRVGVGRGTGSEEFRERTALGLVGFEVGFEGFDFGLGEG
jgi:hypothetical protein